MNGFVWADLSTYNPVQSRGFYERVFGWRFHESSGYLVAMRDDREAVGMFETPAFFQKIRMPHFWMSYIAVDDTMEVANRARSEFPDAKVELTDEFYGGKIALIRDPQGAGFTVYDGGKLNSRISDAGHLMWNELHVSDPNPVIPFYKRLFGWEVVKTRSMAEFQILGPDQNHISDIRVVPNSVKGKYEYWVCTFAVDDLHDTKAAIEECGGGVIVDEGKRVLMYDNSEEAFFYIQRQHDQPSVGPAVEQP